MVLHLHGPTRFLARSFVEAQDRACANIDAVPVERLEYLGLDPSTLVGIDGHRDRWEKTCRLESRAPFLAPGERRMVVRDLRARPEVGDGEDGFDALY